MDDAAFYFSHCRALSRQNNCKKKCAERRTEGSLLLREWTFWLKPKTHTGEFKLNLLPKNHQKILKKKDFCYRLFIYTETIIQKITKNQTLEKDTKNPKKNIKKFKDWFSPSLKINRRKQSNPKKMMNTKSSKIVLPKKATISKKNLKMLDNFSPLVDNQKNVKKNY